MVDLVNPVMGAQNMMLQGAMGAQQKQQQAQYSNALLGAYGGQTPQSFEGMNPEQIQQIQSALGQFSEGQKAATLERINLLDYAANNANEQNYPMIAQAVARAMPELQGQIPQDFQTFSQMRPQILAQVGTTRAMLEGGGAQPEPYQFGSSFQVRDTEGNLFTATQSRDPRTGTIQTQYAPVGGEAARPVGPVEMVGSSGMTPTQAVEQAGATAQATAATEQSIKLGGDAYEALQGINSNLQLYDDAIRTLDEGAQTGPVMSMLPSFRAASIELDNIQARLGLNVIQNTTFGALSEGELRLALNTALPSSLPPAELKEFLIQKKEAQQKLANYLEDAAIFFNRGGSLADWIELQQTRNAAPVNWQDLP